MAPRRCKRVRHGGNPRKVARQRRAGAAHTGSTRRHEARVSPRHSGKTTLAKAAFPGKPWVSLEDPDTRGFAIDDPRGFLAGLRGGAILDEIQRAPTRARPPSA